MNKSLRYIALLAILPLFTTGLGTDYFTDVDALKSKGTGTSQYGSSTGICGLDLCSKYPGGRAGWEADQGTSTIPVAPVEEEHMEKESMEETEADLGSVLRLSRTNVPATIPMHQGYYDGEDVYFIITDSSDPTHAEIITENQGWQVELAPLLKNTPEEALSKTYMFTNGIKGNGVHGFQGEVFTSTPAQADVYSALTSHVHVTWNDGATPRILDSDVMIMKADENNEITLTSVDVVLNMPQIVWPDGQMMVKEDKTLTDVTPYGGGQVLDIDTEEMNVTFITHRGWGPDGRTIYYIVTDATPSGPADMMGVVSSPTSASLIANSAAVDLYQFKNGLTGTGPLGFQPGIAVGAPGDANYSPMWRIFMIGWDNPDDAQLLETIDDINAYKEAGLITIGIARPMDSDHVVNCPFIDPFQ
ncbi:hypothetical protein [Nitrosopumilus sp.]|uniref:DUF7482 domain-containing protein n=1 Tax=Nitrosopumilus sp. TaxID=2024843 RepID=UPI00247BE46E|nr:hypothetical protein [Nitrosopumilus sp.]MCV0431450.1 hypothetical protein [Nitrosopumilus sp.]